MRDFEKIEAYAEKITSFFYLFDMTFLSDPKAEQYLEEARESLREKISKNESALPVILALGGDYDSGLDRAKLGEIDAILSLLEARKNVRSETFAAHDRTGRNAATLKALFDI